MHFTPEDKKYTQKNTRENEKNPSVHPGVSETSDPSEMLNSSQQCQDDSENSQILSWQLLALNTAQSVKNSSCLVLKPGCFSR